MFDIIWDTRGYFFWLLVVSLFVWILERIAPWRKEQKMWRAQFGQDIFWLVFNGHYAGVLIAFLSVWILQQLSHLFDGWQISTVENLNLLASTPLWVQFIVYFILADFIEWCVHNLLHRVPFLWQFHKLHHSIVEMDFIGNMRFHWMEIVVYKSIKYFPLVILGVDGQVILWIAIISTLIGHLNHSNLRIDWGIFRYVINSPRFHIWHHDVILHGEYGKNFAIVLSVWDWLFGTAFYPKETEQPESLGFEDLDKFPKGLLPRLVYPIFKKNS